MKQSKTLSLLATAGLLLGSAGCANDAGNGALIGGGVGALAGGIIGHQSGHTGAGALIGGAVGAGSGALIGHASDEKKLAKQREYDRGYEDAQRASYRQTPSQTPSSGYSSYSETTRTGVGTGGYYSSKSSTATKSETYSR